MEKLWGLTKEALKPGNLFKIAIAVIAIAATNELLADFGFPLGGLFSTPISTVKAWFTKLSGSSAAPPIPPASPGN